MTLFTRTRGKMTLRNHHHHTASLVFEQPSVRTSELPRRFVLVCVDRFDGTMRPTNNELWIDETCMHGLQSVMTFERSVA